MQYDYYSRIRGRKRESFFWFCWFENASSLIELSTLDRIMSPIDSIGIFQIDHCSEVHESIIESANWFFAWFFSTIRYPFLEIFLYYLLFFFWEFQVFSPMIVSSKYFLEIRIPGKHWFSESKSEDSSTGISSYSWEFHQKWFLLREYSSIFSRYDLWCLENISSTRIVSESLIEREKFFITRSCEMMDSRVFLKHASIVSPHTFDLSLLEEYLREPDSIEKKGDILFIIVPPLEIVSAIFLIPIDEISPREWG